MSIRAQWHKHWLASRTAGGWQAALAAGAPDRVPDSAGKTDRFPHATPCQAAPSAIALSLSPTGPPPPSPHPHSAAAAAMASGAEEQMAALSVGDGAAAATAKPDKPKKEKKPKADKPKQVRGVMSGGWQGRGVAGMLLVHGCCCRSHRRRRRLTAVCGLHLLWSAGRRRGWAGRQEEGDQAGADGQQGRRLWRVVLTGGPGLAFSLLRKGTGRQSEWRRQSPARLTSAMPAVPALQVVVESEMISYYDVSGGCGRRLLEAKQGREGAARRSRRLCHSTLASPRPRRATPTPASRLLHPAPLLVRDLGRNQKLV